MAETRHSDHGGARASAAPCDQTSVDELLVRLKRVFGPEEITAMLAERYGEAGTPEALLARAVRELVRMTRVARPSGPGFE